MILNAFGDIVKNQWLWLEQQYWFVILDEFVVMPNHFHGILIIDSDNNKSQELSLVAENSRDCSLPKIKPLPQLIGAFKTTSSKLIHNLESLSKTQYEQIQFKWHKSFYDRIIRTEKELNNVRNYIKNNPLKWSLDIENSSATIEDNKNNDYYEKIIESKK